MLQTISSGSRFDDNNCRISQIRQMAENIVDRTNGTIFFPQQTLGGRTFGPNGTLWDAINRLGPAAAIIIPERGAPLTSRAGFHIQVRSQGYQYPQYPHTTQGGYVLYRHPNGSQIWIRPNGQVIRTALQLLRAVEVQRTGLVLMRQATPSRLTTLTSSWSHFLETEEGWHGRTWATRKYQFVWH